VIVRTLEGRRDTLPRRRTGWPRTERSTVPQHESGRGASTRRAWVSVGGASPRGCRRGGPGLLPALPPSTRPTPAAPDDGEGSASTGPWPGGPLTSADRALQLALQPGCRPCAALLRCRLDPAHPEVGLPVRRSALEVVVVAVIELEAVRAPSRRECGEPPESRGTGRSVPARARAADRRPAHLDELSGRAGPEPTSVSSSGPSGRPQAAQWISASKGCPQTVCTSATRSRELGR
jgi:hypothetical protein